MSKQPTNTAVQDLQALYSYATSPDPSHVPVEEYNRLIQTPLQETILQLSQAGLTDTEYRKLLQYATNQLETPTTLNALQRTKDEFSNLRQRTGASQQWVSDKTGISLSTIRRWEDPNSPYHPSADAWATLDSLAEAEREWAREALENRIREAQRVRRDWGEAYGHWFGPLAASTLTLGLHYYRDETTFQNDLETYYAANWYKQHPYDDPSEPDEEQMDKRCELDSYRNDTSDNFSNPWSVFHQAETYGIQNATTNRLISIIEDHAYDTTLTDRTLAISFNPQAGGMPMSRIVAQALRDNEQAEQTIEKEQQ